MNFDSDPATTPEFNPLIQQHANVRGRLELDAALDMLEQQAIPVDNHEQVKLANQQREARMDLLRRLSTAQQADIALLSEEDQAVYAGAQQAVTEEIAKIIRGEIENSDQLAQFNHREQALIQKVKTAYNTFKLQHPDQRFIPVFSQEEDRLVWNTMIRRSAIESIPGNVAVSSAQQDQQEKQGQQNVQEEQVTDSEPSLSKRGEAVSQSPPSEVKSTEDRTSKVTDIPGVGLVWETVGIPRRGSKVGETESDLEKQVRDPFRHLVEKITSTSDTVRLIHSTDEFGAAGALTNSLNIQGGALEATVRPLSSDQNEALDNLLSPYENRTSAVIIAIPRELYNKYRRGELDPSGEDPLMDRSTGNDFVLKKEFVEGSIDLRTKQYTKKQ